MKQKYISTNFGIVVCITLLLASNKTLSDESRYDFCAISGFYEGMGDVMLSNLALTKMVDEGSVGNSTCNAVYRDAISAGQYMARNGKARNRNDNEILLKATDFKSKIYRFILNGSGYK